MLYFFAFIFGSIVGALAAHIIISSNLDDIASHGVVYRGEIYDLVKRSKDGANE